MTIAFWGMQSCSDDDFGKGKPLAPGTEIAFGAKLVSDTKTRTCYDDEDIENAEATQWRIFWNYSDNSDDLDQIFIYSPQGCNGRNQAKYTVRPTEPNMATAADITKIGDFGVQSSTETTYDFYGLYPASAVNGEADNHIIQGHLPYQQSVSFAGTKEDASATMPDKPTPGSHYYLTKPDMNYCLMTAANTGVTLSADTPVKLQFKPFSTVLDITVNGPVTTNIVDECLVTSVMVIANAPIAGDFSYDFKATDPQEAFKAGDNAKDSIEISTLSYDQDGNLVGIPMANGNTLRLQAFLLPNPDVTDIKIKVFTSDAQTWTQTLKLTHNDTPIFRPSQIHKVELPMLNVEEGEFDYSHWISQLDPRIYLSEVSLPGSTSSFSWKEGTENTMQTIDTRKQFQAGIRVFRGHIWLYDMVSTIDNMSPAFGINVNGQTYVRPLAEVIRILYEEMQLHHPDEFCVLMIADYKQNNKTDTPISNTNSPWNNDNGNLFYQRFKVIMERMAELGYIPDHIDANTTIGDVKGKIIVKLQLNGNGEQDALFISTQTGEAAGTDNVNKLLAKIQGWNNVDESKALMNWWTARNGEELFYAPMTFGKVGSFEYTNFSYGSRGRGTITLGKEGLSSTAANLINTTADTYLSNWRANCSTTAKPENGDLNNVSNMWYIYGAQANPSNNTQWNNAQNLANKAISAINDTYDADSHNKFYMTYLGGAGTGITNTDATKKLVENWNKEREKLNTNGYKPYGWVLFNNIPDVEKTETELSETEKLVQKGIKTVISRNNDVNYKLKRKLDVTPVKTTPTGDMKGASNGGPIFY